MTRNKALIIEIQNQVFDKPVTDRLKSLDSAFAKSGLEAFILTEDGFTYASDKPGIYGIALVEEIRFIVARLVIENGFKVIKTTREGTLPE